MKVIIKESTLREIIKEEVRKVMSRKDSYARTIKEDVMKRYYNIEANGHRPMLIERITLDRIVNKHGKNGYIIISANRSNEDENRNVQMTQKLYSEIRTSGYSFLPTYGGYRGTDGVEDDFEPSFIVFNYDNTGKAQDFNILYELGIKWCAEFNQDSFTVKAPNMPPQHINRNGEKVNDYESDNYWKNDSSKQFFTSMIPKDKVNPQNPQRQFTLDIGYLPEIYINPAPCTLNERQRRGREIFLY